MDNELFGEMHEQEENGLYGKRHEAELCFLHSVSQQRELLKAFLNWFDSDLSYLKNHNELIDDYFNSL